MSDTTQSTSQGFLPVVLEYSDRTIGAAGNINDFVLKPVAISEAFRKYNWLKGTAVLNRSGNLRGMVINVRMKTVYDVTKTGSEWLGLLSILIEIGKEMARIRSVYRSDASINEKAPRILLLGSAAILRGVTSVVPGAVHLLAMSAEGYAQFYSAATGSSSGNDLSSEIDNADQQIRAQTHKDSLGYGFVIHGL